MNFPVLRHPLLRHPLLHLGLLALVVAGGLQLTRPFSRRCIDVTKETRAGLAQDFTRRAGRPPTPIELSRLVREYVDNEVLFREAQARRLGDGDIIIRRRLIQKMEFVTEGLGGDPAPQGEALSTYFAAHGDRYREPARFSLRHVFVSSDRHGTAAQALAATLREKITSSATGNVQLGDPFPRGAELTSLSQAEIAGIFGTDFAAAVIGLPQGTWSTPLRSSYGFHLVFPTAQTPAALPALDAIATRVRSDYERDRRQELRRAVLDDLRKRYDITDRGSP